MNPIKFMTRKEFHGEEHPTLKNYAVNELDAGDSASKIYSEKEYMFSESGINPSALQNRIGPATGKEYRNSDSRWETFVSYARSQGKEYTDLRCQLDFLIKEFVTE